MRVFIVGIVGLPGSYGGFETLAENLVKLKKNKNIQYYVFTEKESISTEYFGAKIIKLPFKANGASSIIYDFIGMVIGCLRGDVILILGPSAGLFIPFFKLIFPKKKFITNMAGLEWQREKWGNFAKTVIKQNERAAVMHSDVLITDNKGLQEYVMDNYNQKTELIEYGGDQVLNFQHKKSVLEEHNLRIKCYDIAIARAQKDNNIEMILDAYIGASSEIVFVSNWNGSEYGRKVKESYKSHKNIKLIGPYYERNSLQTLRSSARFYIHGHSAGGTNPTLVEAMWSNLPIFAFENIFNRYTLDGNAHFFNSDQALRKLCAKVTHNSLIEQTNINYKLAADKYKWSRIVRLYENLY